MSSGAEPAAAAGGAGEASPLHAAAASGALDAVRRLAKTHDVNARDGEDRTPLKLAAAARHVVVAVFLLSRGAKLGDGDEASRPSAGDDSPASAAALRPAQQQALGRAKAALRALAGTVREHALRTVEPGW